VRMFIMRTVILYGRRYHHITIYSREVFPLQLLHALAIILTIMFYPQILIFSFFIMLLF
jgi:hypothetical protein